MTRTAYVVESGLHYCTVHSGILDIDEEDQPCDMVELHDQANAKCSFTPLLYEVEQTA